MRKRNMLFVLLACGLLGAIAFLSLRGRGPSYNGHSLEYWVSHVDTISGRYPDMHDAARAINEIGTNALPFLLSWMEAEPQPWRTKAAAFLRGRRPYWLYRWVADDPKQARAIRALHAFTALKDKGIPAIPELAQRMNNPAKPETACCAIGALAGLGTNSLPVFLSAIANPNHHDRVLVLEFFRQMHLPPSAAATAVPVLIQCLNDSTTLGVAGRAAQTLGSFHVAPELVVPALIAGVDRSNACPRESAAMALAEFGAKARPAVPALKRALVDPHPEVRSCVRIALLQIAPEVLTNTPAQ